MEWINEGSNVVELGFDFEEGTASDEEFANINIPGEYSALTTSSRTNQANKSFSLLSGVASTSNVGQRSGMSFTRGVANHQNSWKRRIEATVNQPCKKQRVYGRY